MWSWISFTSGSRADQMYFISLEATSSRSSWDIPIHLHSIRELHPPLVLLPNGLLRNTSRGRQPSCLPEFSWLPLHIKEQQLDIKVHSNRWAHSLYHVERNQPTCGEVSSWLLVCEIILSVTATTLWPHVRGFNNDWPVNCSQGS